MTLKFCMPNKHFPFLWEKNGNLKLKYFVLRTILTKRFYIQHSISAILVKGSVTLLHQKIERYVSTNFSFIFEESPLKIFGT